ncbi:MAG TPA: biotin/lipoyl-binding carrier protein [Microthrixaceae bacterium]|nr:biotin/lipoyl-binding carrier protein [Microthrixaceae bacterium]
MTEVRAEITANVWQVPAEVGQTIAEGDELVILESMKMEIPVVAPCSGTITAIHVEPDGQVKEGDLVLEIRES